jgi:hypothetical protein
MKLKAVPEHESTGLSPFVRMLKQFYSYATYYHTALAQEREGEKVTPLMPFHWQWQDASQIYENYQGSEYQATGQGTTLSGGLGKDLGPRNPDSTT